MNQIQVEFFHDVICSFCFPMSYRIRQVQQRMPEVEIVHRSFALVREVGDFAAMFSSREAAKEEILHHWAAANQNDDEHRFNIEGMRRANFPFPSSMPALLACKAAGIVAGGADYWDVFDALQTALFVQNQNVEAPDVIEACVKGTGIDFAAWAKQYKSDETLAAVKDDLRLAARYGIHGAPCLVINGTAKVSGAQPLDVIVRAITGAAPQNDAAAACRLEDGEVRCD